MRMIEGACRNARHAHPNWDFDPRLEKSIAKRATGTLTAGWAEVLAAKPSVSVAEQLPSGDGPQERKPLGPTSVKPAQRAIGLRGRTRLIHNRIRAMAGEARRAGNIERLNALADVLRLFAEGA